MQKGKKTGVAPKKTTASTQVEKEAQHNELLIERAHEWAHFHRNPRSRDRMDEALKGLCKADQRKVYLCGQRIAAGLTVRLAK